jgi:CheY-like chemotaxis protein
VPAITRAYANPPNWKRYSVTIPYLGSTGFGVELARDGESGLEKAQYGPTAIVLDIKLPGMDGWEVLRSLKSDPVTKGIPVVVVSIVDERARSLGLGAVGHLVKPASRDALLSTLSDAGLSFSSDDTVLEERSATT